MRYYNFVMDSARWEGFPLRSDDIIISTPAKCGTTWTQRLCSLVLGVEPSPDRPLAVISPWLDMLTRPREEVVAALEAQEHRRFIKTHTPLDGLPWHDDVTYLVVGRDPRDVAISWAHHLDNMEMSTFISARADAVGLADLAVLMPDGPPPPPPEDPLERFWTWIDEDQTDGGLRGLVHLIETFWAVKTKPNVHLFHYSDMKADLPAEVRRLAGVLEVSVDEDDVERIAAAATFETMRAAANEMTPNTDRSFWKDTAGFFHRGTSGQWRDLLGPDDLARYETTVEALGPPDLVHWLHEGRAARSVGVR